MKKFLISFLLLCLLGGFTGNSNQLKVSYLANCSFLYESGGEKVLIDPFGTEFGGFFYLPSDSLRLAVEEGKAPFDRLNLVLITHVHGDHFNPFLAEKFLQKNPSVKMVCPRQVYKQMADSCTRFNHIKNQIVSPELKMNESKALNVNGIAINVIRMQHGTDRSLEGVPFSDYTEYEKTENFGYVISLNKHFLFHQGDGDLSINKEALKKIGCQPQIANLGFFDWDSVSYRILKQDLKAENVLFMHGTKPAKELQSEQFREVIPQIIFFSKEMDSKTFE